MRQEIISKLLSRSKAILILKVILVRWEQNRLLFFFFFFFFVFTNKSLWHSPFRTVDLEVTKKWQLIIFNHQAWLHVS